MMRQFPRTGKLLSLVAALQLSALVAHATFEEVVTSTVHGGTPYLLVIEEQSTTSGSAASGRVPGIYVRDAAVPDAMHWLPAVQGRVMPVPVRGGVLTQLEMAEVTNRFECLSVLDGRLTLFTVKSRPGVAGSIAVLGEGALTAVDPVDGSTVVLPPIASYDNVSVHQRYFQDGVQLVLVSLRAPTPKGDGITLAFVLNADDNHNDAVVPAYRPILLDWNYLSTSQLSQRILTRERSRYGTTTSSNTYLYSSAALRRFTLGASSEPRPLQRWRTMISDILSGATDLDAIDSGARNRLPLIAVSDGLLSVGELPYATISSRGSSSELISVYDPFSGIREGVYAPGSTRASHPTEENLSALSPIIAGRAACNASGCMDADEVAIGRNKFIMLRMEDGRLYLVAELSGSDDAFDSQLLRPVGAVSSGREVEAVSWQPTDSHNIILVSWKFADGGAVTVAYQVDITNYSLQLQGAVAVAHSYYTADELRQRISRSNLSGNPPLFDAFTSVPEGGDYIEHHRLTTPHIDLQETMRRGAISTVFPEPLQTIRIDEKVEYKIYEAQGGYSDLTGLYRLTSSGKDKQLKRGRILNVTPEQPSPLRTERDAPAIIESLQVNVRGHGELHLKSFFLDRNNRGEMTAEPAILLNSAQGEQIASVLELSPTIDITSGVQYFRAFPLTPPPVAEEGRQRPQPALPQQWLYVLGLKKGLTQSFMVSLYEEGGKPTLRFDNATTLSGNSTMELPEVQGRLRFDGVGGVYFVMTPDLDPHDSNYLLYNLVQNSGYRPNRSTGVTRTRFVTFDEYHQAAPENPDYESPGAAWRVWAHSRTVQDQAAILRNMPDYQNDLFPEVRELHDNLANISIAPRRVVLIYPNELKTYFRNYAMALRARQSSTATHWNERRSDFHLYQIEKHRATTQDEVLTVLRHLKEQGRDGLTRPVLMGTLNTVREAGRPALTVRNGITEGFTVHEQAVASTERSLTGNPETSPEATSTSVPPALSYWLATEGRTLELPEFRDSTSAPSYSTILIGTEDEWAHLLRESSPENAYGLAEKYEVIHVPPLARSFREAYVLSLLDRPEIRALGYRYSAANLVAESEDGNASTEAEARRALASYLVNRTERLCLSNGTAIYQGFINVLNRLGQELTTNATLRRERLINRGTIEQLLSRVFSMPLNINLLGANDPLSILYRHGEGQKPGDEAVFQWHLAGYYGDPRLKHDVINTILSQLQSSDNKGSSSAMIIVGGSGTGKTYLITTLLYDVLGLKPYRFEEGAQNEEASVFFLSMSRVYDDTTHKTPPSSGSMSLSQALEHLDKFLAGPNGYRGYVIMDDMHLAPDEVRRRFIAKERTWLDQPTYSATVKGRSVELPTRYLTPIITLNPTDNQERLQKFAGKNGEITTAVRILATLSAANGSADIDLSFLRRQGRTIDLNEFPAEAKAPQLAVQSRRVSQTVLENDSKFVVASDAAIQLMSTRFARADARSFLSAATTALTVPARSTPGGAFIVIPRPENAVDPESLPQRSSYTASGTEIVSEIEAFGEARMHFVAVDNARSFRGRAALAHFIAENFRRNILRTTMRALTLDPRFAQGKGNQQFWGAPLMQAVHDHINQHKTLDVESLAIEPRELGYTSVDEIAQFRRALHAYSLEQQIVSTELPFLDRSRASSTLDQFLGSGIGAHQRSRADVMRQAADEIATLMERVLAANLKVAELRQMPSNHRSWLAQLDSRPINLMEVGGAEMVAIIVRFLTQIDSRAVDSMGGGPLSNYEAMRLFFMVFDQAMARMPWGKVTEHFNGVIRAVVSNAAVAQLQPVQQYLFEDRSSLMVSQDLATMLLLSEGFPYFREGDGEGRRTSFRDRCKTWLEPGNGGGST